MTLLMGSTACAGTLPGEPSLGRAPSGNAAPVRDTSGARVGTVILAGVGVAAAVGAASFTLASASENSSIRDGELATGRDIEDAASRGQLYNDLAFGSGALAIGAFASAIGLYLYSHGDAPSGGSSTLERR